MSRRRSIRLFGLVSLASLTLSCAAPASQPATQPGTSPAPAGTAPVVSDADRLFSALFVVGTRTADTGMQVYNRLHGAKSAAKLHVLQADGEDDEGAGDDEQASAAEDDEELDGEWDDSEFESFDVSDEEEAYLDLDGDEVDEDYEEASYTDADPSDGPGGDRDLDQDIEVVADDISGDTGHLDVNERVDANGKVRDGKIAYKPDDRAKGFGLAEQTVHYDVPTEHEKTGNQVDVTVEGKAGSVSGSQEKTEQWGSSVAKFKEKVLPSGAVTMAGTVTLDSGLTMTLAGEMRPDGGRDLTVSGGGYVIVFKDVKDLRMARGVVLDKQPDQPDARIVAKIIVSPTAPTRIVSLQTPLSYAAEKATVFKPETSYRVASAASGPSMSGFWLGFGKPDAAGARAISSRMAIAWGAGSHGVTVEGLHPSEMSGLPDRFTARDAATGASLSVTFSTAGDMMTLGSGDQRVRIQQNPDGTFDVAGRHARDAAGAGALLASTALGRETSVHAVAGLVASLSRMPAAAMRSSCPPGVERYHVLRECPRGSGPMPGYRVMQQDVLAGWIAARSAR